MKVLVTGVAGQLGHFQYLLVEYKNPGRYTGCIYAICADGHYR